MPESAAEQSVYGKLNDMANDKIKDQITEMVKEGISDSGEVGDVAVSLYDDAKSAYNTGASWKNAWAELTSSDANTQIQGTVDASLNLNDEFNANLRHSAIGIALRRSHIHYR